MKLVAAVVAFIFLAEPCFSKSADHDQWLVQQDFIRRAASQWDNLRGDCSTMLADIYPDISQHPQIRIAALLLSPDSQLHDRAVRELRSKSVVNKFEMEAFSLLLLHSPIGESVSSLLRLQQNLNPGQAFWANIKTALVNSHLSPHLTTRALKFLNSRPDIVGLAPNDVDVEVSRLPDQDSDLTYERDQFLHLRESLSRR